METEGIQEESGVLASSAGVWEWGNLLDFSIDDDSTLLSWDSQQEQEPEPEQEEQEQRQQQQQPPPPSATTQPTAGMAKGPSLRSPRGDPPSLPSQSMPNRTRKRDPRLTCANFIAGRVPCACPEVDDKEDEAMIRKRAKTAVRCQVPGCEADITELKGYHRRHRVCLRCAYAPTVMLDGHLNRYCQQCGKFHVLSDFDEGKRSCRRKLERHNHRRRRKSGDCKSGTEVFRSLERGTPGANLVEHNDCDDETGKEKLPGESCGADSFQTNELSMDKCRMHESEDVLDSPFSSAVGQANPSFQNIPSESIPSCTTSGGAHKEVVKASRSTISSSFCDNKSAYSSVCPTGRVSFKLYDWNPAEFPRRLRHQLSEDDVAFTNDLVNAPQSLLSGRGSLLIYLNNSIFQLLEDGSSVTNIKAKVQAPRLHYVHPLCFEAGKPMEFIACGRNLVQPRLRFLISFSGRYLRYECCQVFSVAKSACKYEMNGDDGEDQNYEIFKVRIPQTETGLYGPAFIEVENESGLSNFIPVLVGDQQIVSEFKIVQQVLGGCASSCATESPFTVPYTFSEEKRKMMSEFLLDVAWLIKEPDKDETCIQLFHVQRLNHLLEFLITNNLVNIMKKVLQLPKFVMVLGYLNKFLDREACVHVDTFHEYIRNAREIISAGAAFTYSISFAPNLHNDNTAKQEFAILPDGFENCVYSTGHHVGEEKKMQKDEMGYNRPNRACSLVQMGDEKSPLLIKDFVMKVNNYQRQSTGVAWNRNARLGIFAGSYMSRRLLVITVAAIAFCCGLCIILRHPHKVWEFSHAVQKCWLGIHAHGRHRQNT
ncbi:unnamed protein product [Victoria cruziana]